MPPRPSRRCREHLLKCDPNVRRGEDEVPDLSLWLVKGSALPRGPKPSFRGDVAPPVGITIGCSCLPAASKEVRTFRDRFTGGVPLDLQRAELFVKSPAAANLPTSWFEENGTPFVDHDARMVLVDHEDRWEVLEFRVYPPGVVFRIELMRGPEAPEYRGRMLVVVGPRRFEQPEIATLVRVGSPLDQLRKVGARLATLYPEWQDYSATRFVLTGEAPAVDPLRWELGPGSTTVLYVAPGISPATVEKAYRRALWSQGRKKERYSPKDASSGGAAKSVRRLREKNLKLLRFVVARTDNRGQRPSGKEVVAEWDREQPQWAYHGDTRSMWRDYNRALKHVAPTLAQARKRSRERQ
jgi:hypothetical protein